MDGGRLVAAHVAEAREQGKLVAYVTAVAPVEILVAHDLIPIYPENHAAACLAKKMGAHLCGRVERAGYTSHLCSYARSDLGYRATGDSPKGGIPEPDFLLAGNAQCTTLTKWFEILARRYNVPLFVFDTPQWIPDAGVRRSIVRYCVSQLRELISTLEGVTGRRFNYDRLAEVLAYSRQACLAYRRFLDMAALKPSPISIFDALTQMVVIVALRGERRCAEYYQSLCAELEAKGREGFAAVPGERLRLYWENLPIWFKFRDHFELFKAYGANILTSLYVHAWCYEFDLAKDPLVTLAENYCAVFSNRTLAERGGMAMELFRRYQLDGALMFVNRSCKAVSFAVYQLKEMFSEMLGTPTIIFEADMGDQRFYAEAQLNTRLEAFLETLQRRFLD